MLDKAVKEALRAELKEIDRQTDIMKEKCEMLCDRCDVIVTLLIMDEEELI